MRHSAHRLLVNIGRQIVSVCYYVWAESWYLLPNTYRSHQTAVKTHSDLIAIQRKYLDKLQAARSGNLIWWPCSS